MNLTCHRPLPETDGSTTVRKPAVWQDMATGRCHAVNNETGEAVPCTITGTPLPQFHKGISGVASTKQRLGLTLKDTALYKSLQGPPPARPPPLSPRLEGERITTTGRFCAKVPCESELFLQQQLRARRDYPEIENARREEEAKARFKIDELHKNFYALQASTQNGGAVAESGSVREVKNLSRSEQYTFTATGVYRP